MTGHAAWRERPFPPIRDAYIDVLREGQRRRMIHGLFEADVSRARTLLPTIPDDGGDPMSFTGWVVACVAAAVDEDRLLHARRRGRRRLVLFDDVDVNVQIEQPTEVGSIVQSRIIRDANHRTAGSISAEVHAARAVTAADRRRERGTRAFVRLPRLVRVPLWRAVMDRPGLAKRFGGTIGVSAVGMFGTGAGWGIPLAPVPLMVTIGGIGPRPVLADGVLVNRDHLCLTISVDHDIIDGAPAARFAARLRELLEAAAGITSPEA